MFTLRLLYISLICFILSISNSQAKSISSIVIDAKSGNVLYSQNAEKLHYPASLTKLMTLYITFNALETGKLKFSDKLKVSHTAASRSPSRLGAPVGTSIDVKTLVDALIIKSANDCATVLSEYFAPSEAEFAKIMTSTAKKLGMNDTTFKNASGLPNSKQKTTAKDMAILGVAIYNHFPQYYHLFSNNTFKYNDITYKSHNHLLKDFEGADGMKTGFTNASGYNIVTSAKQDKYRVIAVTLGHNQAKDRDNTISKMMKYSLDYMKKSKLINVAKLKKDINDSLGYKTRTAYK